MEAEAFDEVGFFRALAHEGVRDLLIGRRALAALGAPLVTADDDLWVDLDDAEALNRVAARFDLAPTCSAEEARRRGRYVLEGPEPVEVRVARAKRTVDGVELRFADAYTRRVPTGPSGPVLPSIDDWILTKRWALRPKDLHDLEFLELLRGGAP